jgi:type I restriction enzyme S subunit
MQTYDKYKDSGVEWIGEVPEHWGVRKIKTLSLVKRGASPRPIDDPKYFDENGKYSWVRIADVSASDKYLYDTTQKLSKLGSSLSVKRHPGDLFVSIAGTVGKPIITRINCCIHDGFVYFPNLNKCDNTFLYYIFLSGQPYLGLGKMGTQLNLNTETIGNISISYPSESIQRLIVSYLDKKCADIDKVIATQQRRIELLQELKQSTITHAVTHGLNPNVKMKDSGVEWIGEVPEHWKVMKSSLMSSLIGSGTTPNTNNKDYYCENEEEGYNWLQTGDLNNGLIISTLKKVTLKAVKECNLKFYTTGSIVIAMYGATIGKVGILGFNTAVNQACCVLSKTDKIVSKFVFYLFLSAKESLLISAIGGGQPNISQEVIKKLKVVVPPLSEQRSIATYLDKKCVELDKSISKAQREIDLLQEYKQALITEVVTGKRKVS